jgi:hypothetical protein
MVEGRKHGCWRVAVSTLDARLHSAQESRRSHVLPCQLPSYGYLHMGREPSECSVFSRRVFRRLAVLPREAYLTYMSYYLR